LQQTAKTGALFKYVSIELLEGHYIDDLSLNALKIFLE
jgi:hypothetical protein